MRKVRRLGRTGFEVAVLGLGGHTYPVGHGPLFFISPEERAGIIRYLVDSGVNYFDTTWIEEVKMLADSFKRADIREDALVSLQYVDSISGPCWRRNLRQEIETRLSILSYSHAPLFLMGMGNESVSYAELVAACEAMTKFKEEGLIRNIGISCHKIELFSLISRAIQETDLIDYVMIRFNWKYRQANEELFPVAKAHDVGIVAMKAFCWDCRPGHWDSRISVFEPGRYSSIQNSFGLTPAQRNIVWCLDNAPCAVVVPAMNTLREAEENIRALQFIGAGVSTDDFVDYSKRLSDRRELTWLAFHAESSTIRERAKHLLKLNKPDLFSFLKIWH